MNHFLIILIGISFLFNISYSGDYVEGEVLVKLKKPEIAPQSNNNLSIQTIQITGSDIKIQSIFKTGKEQILLIKSKNKTTEELIKQLKNNPLVEKVEPNYIIKPSQIPNDSVFQGDYSRYWGFDKISAFDAWDISIGFNDVVVAVLDTGVDYKHPDLKRNIWRNLKECNGIPGIDDDNDGYIDDCIGYDMYENDNDPSPGNENNKHGTHVTGIIGAVGNNSIGIAGVNWNIRILPCKIFDNDGSSTTTSVIIKCLDYITNLKKKGINIVASNNSWAGSKGSYLGDLLKETIQKSVNAGILFVTAAGNQSGDYDPNNDNVPVYPCNYKLDNDGIICVSASDTNDRLPWFSYYGAESVDIAAPGFEIYSTVPTGLLHIGRYEKESGTSMATPFVTGAVALLKSKYPYLNWKDLKVSVLINVDKIPDFEDKVLSGGRLNLFETLKNPVKALDNDFGVSFKPDEYSILDSGFLKDNDYILSDDRYKFYKKPFCIKIMPTTSYAGIKFSMIKVPDGIKVVFCEPKTKVCSLIDENLLYKYNNSIELNLEDNDEYDIDNEVGVIKTQLAFVTPSKNIKTNSDSSGGGCSVSKRTDFSLFTAIIVIGCIILLRRINKSMQLRSNQV